MDNPKVLGIIEVVFTEATQIDFVHYLMVLGDDFVKTTENFDRVKVERSYHYVQGFIESSKAVVLIAQPDCNVLLPANDVLEVDNEGNYLLLIAFLLRSTPEQAEA